MRRWPVIDVLAIQTARNNTFPRAWTTVPAGMYEPARPLVNQYTDSASATLPDGAQRINVAPGFVDWRHGRNGYRVLVSYTNGWPHSSLTAVANLGDTTVHVDDVTGFAGAQAFVYDGQLTETVTVLSVAATSPLSLPNGAGTAQTGPGTVALSSGLASAHQVGVVVSALPANVQQAAIYFCVAQALTRGATATAVQAISGGASGGGPSTSDDYVAMAEAELSAYRRII